MVYWGKKERERDRQTDRHTEMKWCHFPIKLKSDLLSYQVVGSCVIDGSNLLREHLHSDCLMSEGSFVHFTKSSFANDVLCAKIAVATKIIS